jgi:predicted dehydrogenase
VFWGILEFRGGAIGVVETIWLLPEAAGIGLDDSFQLLGESGVGNVRLIPEAVSFWHREGYRAPDCSYYPELSGPARGALREELAYFRDCLLDGVPPRKIPPREAMEAVRVALALIESARTDREIALASFGSG